MTIGEIYQVVDRIAPFASAEDWDNSGLLVGGMGMQVNKVLVTLDCSGAAVRRAAEAGAQLILAHHPVIFDPLYNLSATQPAVKAALAGIGVLCAHTNVDKADGGLSDLLAAAAGLQDIVKPEGPFGRIGSLPGALSAPQFADRMKKALGCARVVFNDPGVVIKKVFVCSGAGGSLVEEAIAAGCQALVCGDVKHDRFLAAEELDLSVFDCGHFYTEQLFVPKIKKLLEKEFPALAVESFDSRVFHTR